MRRHARRRRLSLDRVAGAVIEGLADDAGLRREVEGPLDGPS
ncbi:hypothetical protein [Streptomyces sp. V4I2]|nr:hypothetical protein [Streptomyces sp. V4I2]